VGNGDTGDWEPRGQRIPPLAPDAWDERARRVLAPTGERVAALQGAPQPKPLHILTTLAHHSALLEPFLALMTSLATAGTLPRRDAEIMALRAAWNCRSAFEWGHHRLYGLAAGLSEAEVAAVARDADAGPFRDHEAALLRAADELHAHQNVTPETWAVLAAHYDERQLIELLFTVGQYTHLSMVANALGIELEPHLPGLPDSD